jgi:hypothetical protein
MTLRERFAAAASSESGVIFTLGFLVGFPHFFYADLAWQLAEGRSLWNGTFPIALPEAISAGPWIDHEWLFEAVAWPFWAHGAWPVFAALCTALVAAVPVAAVAIARRCGATPFAANAVGYLTIASAVTAYAVRPQSIAECCFALTLFLVLGPLRRPWLLFPLTVLWANVHGSVVLAPVTILVVAAGEWIRGGTAPRKLFEAAAWALAGSFVTPHGFGTWSSAVAIASRSEIGTIAEWQPVSFAYPIEFFVLVAYGVPLVLGGVPFERPNATALLLLATFAPLWLLEARFLPFFGIAAIPALAIAIARAQVYLRRRRPARAEAHASALLIAPLAVAIIVAAVFFAPATLRLDREVRATDDLVRTENFRGRLFAPFPAGGYLQLREEPVLVLLDSHALPFGPAVWHDYATIDAARVGWREALAHYRITGVVAAEGSALAAALGAAGGWHVAGSTSGELLFVRTHGAT